MLQTPCGQPREGLYLDPPAQDLLAKFASTLECNGKATSTLAAAAGSRAVHPEGTQQERGHIGQAPKVISNKPGKLLAWQFWSRGVPPPQAHVCAATLR